MSRDFVYIGSTPCDEPCQQLGMPSWNRSEAIRECRVFIEQLRRINGPEPDGAELCIKWERHDFGTYPEVVCWYDEEKPASVDYAFGCENNAPANWDIQATCDLQPSTIAGYRLTFGAVLASK